MIGQREQSREKLVNITGLKREQCKGEKGLFFLFCLYHKIKKEIDLFLKVRLFLKIKKETDFFFQAFPSFIFLLEIKIRSYFKVVVYFCNKL